MFLKFLIVFTTSGNTATHETRNYNLFADSCDFLRSR